MGNSPAPAKVVAIDNRTPFTFTWANQVTPRHHTRLNPGRMWTTHPTESDGVVVPNFDAKDPEKRAYRFELEPPLFAAPTDWKKKVFWLCKDGDKLKYFTDKTKANPVVVATGVTNDGLQLTILGPSFEELRFSLQHNNFPTWEKQACIAGVMNNSRFQMRVVKTYPDNHRVMKEVEDRSYVDLSKLEKHPTDSLHSGLIIPDAKQPTFVFHDPRITIALYDPARRTNVQEWDIRVLGKDIEHFCSRPGHQMAQLDLIPGGHSQLDSPIKYLDIVEEASGWHTLRMLERPSDLSPLLNDGHCLGPKANLLVSMDTDLLQNIKMAGKNSTTEYNSFVTRIKLTDRQKKPFSFLDVSITSTPVIVVSVSGDDSKLDNPKPTFQTDAEGVITITQPVDKHIGAVVFHIGITHDSIAPVPVTVDIHAGDKIASKMQHLKSTTDWKEAKDKKGQYIFKDRNSIDDETIGILKNVILMTAVPRKWNPIATPNKEIPDPNNPIISGPENSMSGFGGGIAAGGIVGGIVGAAGRPVAGPALPKTIPLVPLYRPSVAHLPKDYAVVMNLKKKTIKKGGEARATFDAARLESAPAPSTIIIAGTSIAGIATSSASSGKADDNLSLWDRLCAWAKNAWDDIVEVGFRVVGEFVQFLVDGAVRIVNCVAEAFAALGAIISKWFEAAFEGFVEWLGELFDWNAIGHAYTMVRTVANQSFAALEYGIDYATSFLKGKLNLADTKKRMKDAGTIPNISKPAGSVADNPPESDDPNVEVVSGASNSEHQQTCRLGGR